MYEIVVIDEFSAAHNLRNYHGNCERLHGHNWKVEVSVCGDTLENGMLIDFRILKGYLNDILALLDHNYINDIAPFDKLNPTSENIARFIYERLQNSLKENNNLKINRVKVYESKNAMAIYYSDDSNC